MQRFTVKLVGVDHAQDFYGVIGDWRRWSEHVTLQPYCFLLKQNGQQVRHDLNGNVAVPSGRIYRKIHTAGLRVYGVVGTSGWDDDASYTKQWGGYQDRLNNQGSFIAQLDHDAYAYNIELGYAIKHAWKPRISAFYGFASGDSNPNDTSN